MKDATIDDVAARADVSKSTVSAVINDKDIVSASTREQVLDAIDELNYRPRGAARRGFAATSGKSLGFVIKETTNPYYTEVQEGIREVAVERGYLPYICSSEGDFDEEKKIVRQFVSKDLNGLIITPIVNDDADVSHLFELKRNNIPFVLLEGVQGLQANLVDIDNVQASCEAVKHLIDLGHERIVHFGGPGYSQHTQRRIEGVRRAFSESHLVYGTDTTLSIGDSVADGYEHGHEYFGSRSPDDRPTAVTCYNDLTALGLMRALHELDIDVPGDVSVVGFDDLDLLGYFPTALSTIHVPKREMGRRATEILLQQIESGPPPVPEKVTLEARFKDRSTTAPPPGMR